MPRSDLIALTDDGLTQLSNAGLVKRGLREIAEGKAPIISEAADGTIEARFGDGTIARLRLGLAPADASCSCPSSSICRHRVSLVLAYRAAFASQAPAAVQDWDPAGLDMSALEATFTGAAQIELDRLRATPMTVRLTRGATPSATMPMATVRFLAPNDAAYARCDCAAGHSCAHVICAVEAFRAARGAGHVSMGLQIATQNSLLREATDGVLARLLSDGVTAGMAAHGALIDRARAMADVAGATWLVLALEALAAQIAAYDARSALHDETEVLQIAVELFARPRTSLATAMGFGEAMQTAMSKTRLASLGGRLEARGKQVLARIAFLDTDTGTTMSLSKLFSPAPADAPLLSVDLLTRHVMPGMSLRAVARGQLLTAVAHRRADGSVGFGSGKHGKTTLLGRKLLIESPPGHVAANAEELRAALVQESPRFLQSRNRAAGLRVFNIERVEGQAFDPGAQIWHAAVDLADNGGSLMLRRRYDAAAPGAIQCLSDALQGATAPLRQISGEVRIEDGILVCDPWALSTDQLVVPDVDASQAEGQADAVPSIQPEAGLGELRRFLAGVLHGGSRRDPTLVRQGEQLAKTIEQLGYATTMAKMNACLATAYGDVEAFGQFAVWLETVLED